MEKFETLTGIAAPVGDANIDTDRIIPARFLKTIKRTGLGKHLFNDVRYASPSCSKTRSSARTPASRSIWRTSRSPARTARRSHSTSIRSASTAC